MSLMAMNRAIKKYGTFWGIALGLLMVVGIGYSGLGRNVSSGAARGAAPEDVVATVGEQPVSHRELERRLDQMVKQQSFMGQMPSETDKSRIRYMLLSQVKQEQALVAAAKKAGVAATDADIARERDKVWAQARPQFAQTLGLTATATDAEVEKALEQQEPGMTVARLKAERIPEEAVRLQLYQNGLVAQAKQQVKANEADVRRSYDEIQVRHILIKSGEGGLPDADAKAKAEKLLAEIKATPAKMASLATQFSDDPGSKAKGGLYDWNAAGTYVSEFTNAALAAGVGKVYPEIVKTSFGYHIIKLEGERPGKDFPKDFDKEKQKYIDQYVDKLAQQKAQSLIAAEMPNIKTDVTDPMLKAAQFQDEAAKAKDPKERDAKLELALTELGKIKPESDPGGAVPLQKAAIYTQMKKTDAMIASYEEALKSSNSVETRLALAQAYLDNKNTDGAKVQLAEAEKLAVPDVQTQDRLGFLWEKAGDKAKAKIARDKAMEMLQRMAQMQKAQQATLPGGGIPGVTDQAPPAPSDSAPPAGNVPPGPPAPAIPPAGTPAPK